MISKVIAWKFNNQEGVRCREIDGVMTITKFPGGIPSQTDQDLWTQEYIAAGGDDEIEKEQVVNFANVDPFLKAFVLAVNDGSIIPGSNMTPAELKAAVKAKL